MDLKGTPLELGFRMPAEWEPHNRCWMAWPTNPDLWPTGFEAARRDYAKVAAAVAHFEPLTMIAHPRDAKGAAEACGEAVTILPLEIDDSWTRDSGPTFVTDANGRLAGVDWVFNAWGEKHRPYDSDARMTENLLSHLGMPRFDSPLTFEGGALHCDGAGTVITTESVLLNPNRNPGLTLAEGEQLIRQALGCEKVIVLPGDWEEYETDGHVDGIACFIRPGVAMVETCLDPAVPYSEALRENRRALELATDASGRHLELIDLPEATEATATSDIFCSSYINFYLANGGVVLPGYGIAGDEVARDIVARAFPDREILQVDINGIAPGGGGIHCITQQQPA